MESAKQLNWTPGAGIVAPVSPNVIPHFDLPESASPIQHHGKPAYHVTLIKRRAIEHCTKAMHRVWPGILTDPPDVPVAEPGHELIEAEDPGSGTLAWIVHLRNADAFEVLRQDLIERLERAFDAAGFVGLRIRDVPVRWHITLANNRGGDPFKSSGDPLRHLNPKEN